MFSAPGGARIHGLYIMRLTVFFNKMFSAPGEAQTHGLDIFPKIGTFFESARNRLFLTQKDSKMMM